MTGNGINHGSPSEALYSLVYTSEARALFDDSALDDLLQRSRAANHAKGITGILLFRRGRFVQFLEGPEGSVRALMNRIAEDRRHAKVRILIDGNPSHRQFGSWTMGYQPIQAPSTPTPQGFRDTFEDLESIDDSDAVLRAARELTIWFRAKAGGAHQQTA